MDTSVGRWAAGAHYGPVLSQTDLYLLQTELTINPTLAGTNSGFHLNFNLVDGSCNGFNSESGNRELEFTDKDQPATLPRVAELYIICELSPWCTVVRNERGVTMKDVCAVIHKEYSENVVTDGEFASLPPRMQEQVRRAAMTNAQNAAQARAEQWGPQYYTPAPPQSFKRIDWLRDKIWFESISRKDSYAISRLGFKAPNIFVLSLMG